MANFNVESGLEEPSQSDVGTFLFPSFEEFSLQFNKILPLDILRQIYNTHFEFMRALRMHQMGFNRDFGQMQSRSDVDFHNGEQVIDYLRKIIGTSVAYGMTQNWEQL